MSDSMDSIKKIISDYKRAEQDRLNELQLLKVKELELFTQNALNIEELIKNVICPLFENVKNIVVDAGFCCEKDKILRKIKNDSDKEYILEIKLKVSKSGRAEFIDHYLCYVGNYVDCSVKSEISIGNKQKQMEPRPLSYYSTDCIRKEVESFLKDIFKV